VVREGADSTQASEALRTQAIATLGEFMQALTDARTDLDDFHAALETNRRHLIAGGRANDMTGLFDLPSLRSTLTERLDLVERARMDCRRALWRLQMAEGATIAEIAREWGLSRQLVSRALANLETTVSS
jgi:hypothetical protein